MADEQIPSQSPAQPQPSLSPSELALSPKKPKLPKIVIVFSFLFFVPLSFLLVVYLYLVHLANNGTSGTEYIAILLAPVQIAVAFVGLIYVVLLLLYAARAKYAPPKRRIIALMVALLIAAFYAIGIMQAAQDQHQRDNTRKLLTDAQVLSLIDQCKVESVQKEGNQVGLLLTNDAYYDKNGKYIWQSTTGSAAHWDRFVAEVKKVKSRCGGNIDAIEEKPTVSWISVQEATDLLQKCEVRTFNYTPSGLSGLDSKPKSGTDTGIILVAQPTIHTLFIEPSAEATMVPIARSVQPTCGGPQFFHDGNYEQRRPDGSWYTPTTGTKAY